MDLDGNMYDVYWPMVDAKPEPDQLMGDADQLPDVPMVTNTPSLTIQDVVGVLSSDQQASLEQLVTSRNQSKSNG